MLGLLSLVVLLGALLLLLVGFGLGVWALTSYVGSTMSRRAQTLRCELAGLRAIQRLNLAAWQAQSLLHDLASDGHHLKPQATRGGGRS